MKTVSILLVVLLGFLFALPTFLPADMRQNLPNWLPRQPISLDIEFTGGTRLEYKVDRPEMMKAYLAGMREEIRDVLREHHIGHSGIQIRHNSLKASFRSMLDRNKAFQHLDAYYNSHYRKPVKLERAGDQALIVAISSQVFDDLVESSIRAFMDESRGVRP